MCLASAGSNFRCPSTSGTIGRRTQMRTDSSFCGMLSLESSTTYLGTPFDNFLNFIHKGTWFYKPFARVISVSLKVILNLDGPLIVLLTTTKSSML